MHVFDHRTITWRGYSVKGKVDWWASFVTGRSLAGIAGSNPADGTEVCLLWVLSCQVEVSATGWSLVQRSPTECDMSLCDLEAQEWGGPGPCWAVAPEKKLQYVPRGTRHKATRYAVFSCHFLPLNSKCLVILDLHITFHTKHAGVFTVCQYKMSLNQYTVVHRHFVVLHSVCLSVLVQPLST
jgi:hypothetical protein